MRRSVCFIFCPSLFYENCAKNENLEKRVYTSFRVQVFCECFNVFGKEGWENKTKKEK